MWKYSSAVCLLQANPEIDTTNPLAIPPWRLKHLYSHFTALLWSLNHLLFAGPGTRCPFRHVQKFKGNTVSIAKCRQLTETEKKRLGHPSNQCAWELQRPIPTGARPGNVFDSTGCMHTITSLSALKQSTPFVFLDTMILWVAHSSFFLTFF